MTTTTDYMKFVKTFLGVSALGAGASFIHLDVALFNMIGNLVPQSVGQNVITAINVGVLVGTCYLVYDAFIAEFVNNLGKETPAVPSTTA